MGIVIENKSLTQEELQSLQTIQEKTQYLIVELGEIELIKLQLENRKNKAVSFLNELTEEEQNFTKNIFEKYGKVNINPQNGEITPIS